MVVRGNSDFIETSEENMPKKQGPKDEVGRERARRREREIQRLAKDAAQYFTKFAAAKERFFKDIDAHMTAIQNLVLLEAVGNPDYFGRGMNQKKARTAAQYIGAANTEVRHIKIGLNRLESSATKAVRIALELLEKMPDPAND